METHDDWNRVECKRKGEKMSMVVVVVVVVLVVVAAVMQRGEKNHCL